MTDTILINCDAVRGAFRQWQAEQEPLEAQLSESLAALAAYQSHLDAWQQQLARERDELRTSRDQWEQERGEAGQDQTQINDMEAELTAARSQISVLTDSLSRRDEAEYVAAPRGRGCDEGRSPRRRALVRRADEEWCIEILPCP